MRQLEVVVSLHTADAVEYPGFHNPCSGKCSNRIFPECPSGRTFDRFFPQVLFFRTNCAQRWKEAQVEDICVGQHRRLYADSYDGASVPWTGTSFRKHLGVALSGMGKRTVHLQCYLVQEFDVAWRVAYGMARRGSGTPSVKPLIPSKPDARNPKTQQDRGGRGGGGGGGGGGRQLRVARTRVARRGKGRAGDAGGVRGGGRGRE